MALRGEREVLVSLKRETAKYKRAHLGALLAEGFDIMAKSIPLVPVEFSVLRNSRYVGVAGGVQAALKSETAFVELGFGTDYAVPVHEKDEVSHTVGQSQYLREPFEAALPTMRARMARRVVLFHALGVGPGGMPAMHPKKPKIKKVSDRTRRRARKKKRKARK